MKRAKKLIGFFYVWTVLTTAQANTTAAITEKQLAQEKQERIYCVQLVNQLDAMLPIILAAEKTQPKNQRMTFHYTTWRDGTGKTHPGLLEDVQAIKQGVVDKLNTISVEPRNVPAIQGDYMDHQKITVISK